MTHLLLAVLVFVLAAAGLALGVLLRGRPLARGCDGAVGGGCAHGPAGPAGRGCDGAGSCPQGSGRP